MSTEEEQPNLQDQAANMINNYVTVYRIYDWSIITDLDGRVIGLNNVDIKENSLNTDWIYDVNVKEEPWFKAVLSEDFCSSNELNGIFV